MPLKAKLLVSKHTHTESQGLAVRLAVSSHGLNIQIPLQVLTSSS